MSASRQLGLLWGAVAVVLVGFAPWAVRLAEKMPPCPVKLVFGLPCPSCGVTRAAVALSQLELGRALAVNPLATIGWVALIGGGIGAGMAALLGRGVREPRWDISLASRVGIVLLVLVNWLYLLRAGV